LAAPIVFGNGMMRNFFRFFVCISIGEK